MAALSALVSELVGGPQAAHRPVVDVILVVLGEGLATDACKPVSRPHIVLISLLAETDGASSKEDTSLVTRHGSGSFRSRTSA